MRMVLDACVLYPSVMRRMLLAAAGAGHFVPLWSPRIIEEWVRADTRNGGSHAAVEAALMTAQWADAMVRDGPDPDIDWPDPNDLHVVGTAVRAKAGFIVTRNHRDFPTKRLNTLGLSRSDPDSLLHCIAESDRVPFDTELAIVMGELEALKAGETSVRAVLRRSGLPRLGKFLESKGPDKRA